MRWKFIIAAAVLGLIVNQVMAQEAKESNMHNSSFEITSSGVHKDGALDKDYTGDGKGVSMPLSWTNVPDGTRFFALNLWHKPHPEEDTDDIKSYWVLYNIPGDLRSLPENVKGIGNFGYNDKDGAAYDPMRSKGPGVKEYNVTLFALSAKPIFSSDKVTRKVLLEGIQGVTIDKCTLTYTYERKGQGFLDRLWAAGQKLWGGETDNQGNSNTTPRPEGGETMEKLTDAQNDQIKKILSKYKAATLTEENALAIHEEFRKAGLRGGPSSEGAIREAGFDPQKLRDLAPPPERGDKKDKEDKRDQGSDRQPKPKQKRYSIEQAVSDRAQLTTIGFSGLAFISGDFGASTFIPPGKVCDYFGFQYMRDIDVAEKGHNPMFVDRVVGNVLSILNDHQKQQFKDLAAEQLPQLEELAKMRLPLVKSFHKELDGEYPMGSKGLNREAVKAYVGKLFAFDAQLSIRRGEVLAAVALSLSNEQKGAFSKMKFGDFNSWKELTEKPHLDRSKPKLYNVAYMTYGSEFFSWYAGNIEADTYICPERQGTYFGGFFMKDIEAMSKRDFDISTAITGNSGEAFLNDVCTKEQRQHIMNVLEAQRPLLKEVIEVRRAFSTELRKLLAGKNPDQNKLLELGKRYGELDGELSWNYATAFSKVNKTLTQKQREQLKKLRGIKEYKSAPWYLYSTPQESKPTLKNVDTFFFPVK